MNRIYLFLIINLLGISALLYFSYTYKLSVLKEQEKEPITLYNYLNRGDIPSMKNLIIGLIFGLIFGFIDNFGLWMGIDVFYKYIPGGTLSKAGWGNTYSNVLGALIGTFLADISRIYFDYDSNDQPLWLKSIGILVGCILGMEAGKLITGKK